MWVSVWGYFILKTVGQGYGRVYVCVRADYKYFINFLSLFHTHTHLHTHTHTHRHEFFDTDSPADAMYVLVAGEVGMYVPSMAGDSSSDGE
jgi:hypothetical protein